MVAENTLLKTLIRTAEGSTQKCSQACQGIRHCKASNITTSVKALAAQELGPRGSE